MKFLTLLHNILHVLLVQGASKLREKIEPNQTATEVPTSVQTGVTVARKTSGGWGQGVVGYCQWVGVVSGWVWSVGGWVWSVWVWLVALPSLKLKNYM